ncbi:MAG TPA: hypothetical protein PLM74_06550, partial [Bacillota bacterium]|nr:hypothetical protein [Bacillota bacterium]
ARAEKIQLSTVERPPAGASADRLSVDERERAKECVDDRAGLISSPGLPGVSEESILIGGEGEQQHRRRSNAAALSISLGEGLIDAIRRDDGLTYFGHAHDSEQELIPCQDRPNSDA